MFDFCFQGGGFIVFFYISVSSYGFYSTFVVIILSISKNQLLFLYCVVLKIATANFKNKVQEF